MIEYNILHLNVHVLKMNLEKNTSVLRSYKNALCTVYILYTAPFECDLSFDYYIYNIAN